MSPSVLAAVDAMRERADTLNLARARMAVQLRLICKLAGFKGAKAAAEAELLSLAQEDREGAARDGFIG